MSTVTVEGTKTIWRINLELPDGSSSSIQGYAGMVFVAPDGTRMTSAQTKPTNRAVDSVKEESVDVGGVPVTVEMAVEALQGFCNRWFEEDAEAEEARKEAMKNVPPTLPPNVK